MKGIVICITRGFNSDLSVVFSPYEICMVQNSSLIIFLTLRTPQSMEWRQSLERYQDINDSVETSSFPHTQFDYMISGGSQIHRIYRG